MKRLEDDDIRRLLETPPAAAPPKDLADLLKAQIPDPLPNWEGDEATESPDSPAPPQPLRGPWRRAPWPLVGRLAAALLAMLGVGALSLQLLQWSESNLESPAAFKLADQTSATAERSPAEGPASQTMSDDVITESSTQASVPEAEPPASNVPLADMEGSEAAHVRAAEPSDILPPRRAKKVETPVAQAEVFRRLDVPESAERQEATLDSETARTESAATMTESSRWTQAVVESASEPAPASERVRRPQVDATQGAVPNRARRSTASDELAVRRAAPMDLAKRLETSADSSPWTTAKLASRFVWQPSEVDAADFDRWRQEAEAGSRDLPVDAALMAFGAANDSMTAADELRLEIAPALRAGIDSTFWLLVESSLSSPSLDIEVSSEAVIRYQILAEGFDRATRVGRLLVAMQLTSLPDETGDDVLVKVRRALGENAPREAAPREETLRRRDLAPSWREASWPYRVQTLGVGLVQSQDSGELQRTAEELVIELRQRSAPTETRTRLETWLQWLGSASAQED